jgi:hypothetical protein
MLLCLPHAQKNSKRYWKRAMNLSLPLLLARNREKKMEKLLVRKINSFVIYFVILLVVCACRVRSLKELTLLNDDIKPIIIYIITPTLIYSLATNLSSFNVDLLYQFKRSCKAHLANLWFIFNLEMANLPNPYEQQSPEPCEEEPSLAVNQTITNEYDNF